MRIESRENPGMPRLTWLLRMDRGAGIAILDHGPWVESREGWFAEGAWDAPFPEGRPGDALVLTGTAGEARGNALVLASPTHTVERIHTIRVGDRLYASNSLSCLLAASGEKPSLRYRFYMHDFATITRGIRRYGKSIPMESGRRVSLHYHCNVIVRDDLRLRVVPKRRPPPFPDYAAYRGFLDRTVRAVAENAAHPDRRARYAPLATVSSGYDSPACCVLAAGAGCTEAATFTRGCPRSGASDDDSGTPIAKALGMTVHEFDRTEYLSRTDMVEVEFLATGTGGDQVVLSSMERLLEGRLLFTGDHGDTIWDPHSLRVSEEIKRGDPGGCAFEFRSRVGFLLFPVPFAGAVNHPDIHRVSNSEEMRPWLLGRGSYDRPIPRRIVEERGVARDLFGQAKKVVAQAFLPTTGELEDLATLLSPHTHARFRAFCDSLPRSVTEHRVTFARGMRLLREASLRFVWRAERIARALGRPRLFRAPFERYRLPLSAHNFTFVWANGLVVARYAEALGRGSPDRSIAPLATSR